MTGGSANRRRRQSEGAHHAGESRWPKKQQMNPAGTTRIRFRKVSAFPDSFLTPHRSPQNEGRTETVKVIFVGGKWAGYTREAYDFCQERQIGIYNAGEIAGGLHN